jgi:ABC-2 type transport system permease protein
VVLPLLLASGIFLPMTPGLGWLQGIARISPFRYIIEAIHDLHVTLYKPDPRFRIWRHIGGRV